MAMYQDTIGIQGNVTIEVFEEGGKLLSSETVHNMVLNVGLNNLISALYYTSPGVKLIHFSVGTDGTASDPTDTWLKAQVWYGPLTRLDKPQPDTVRVTHYLPSSAANDNVLQECAVHREDSGLIFARATHSPIQKTENVTILYTWTFTLGRAA